MNATKQKTYGSLSYDADHQRWVLSDTEPHVAIRLKRLFPRIAEGSSGSFTVPDSPDMAVDLLWFFERYPFQRSDRDYQHLSHAANGYHQLQGDVGRILLPDYTPQKRVGLVDGQEVRRYQGVFLDWGDAVKRGILIDDVGLGKSYCGLALRTMDGCGKLVIVVEPHLQQQWYDKGVSFIQGQIYAPKGNKPYDLPDADIYIFKYNQLAPWVDVLTAGWVGSIAFDEVQQLRHGTTTGKGRASKAIINATNGYRFGLTATLIYGYGIEAFNVIDMFAPGLLGSEAEFIREWCTDDGGKKIVKDPDALGAYLREQNVILRRRKADVGQESKQLKPELYWCDPDQKAVADAEALAEQLAITTLTGSFAEAGQAAREFDMRMRELTGISKAKAVAAWVRMFVESGTPVLLFGWHREVYRIWLNELKDLNPLMFTGSETPAQKEANKQAFLNGETNILIMSLRSGSGTDGLQSRCSTVIHGELDPAPNIHVQATGRLDRDGQQEPVFSFFGVTNYGSDPVMLDILGLKETQGRGIQDPGIAKDEHQADPERIKKMAVAFLEQRKVKVCLPESNQPTPNITSDQLALI